MSLAHDLRIGLRAIRKAPGFAATAILTMALGIGATTAVFSVADGMLWKPIPLPHLETLVVVMGRVPDNPRDWNDTTPADVADIRREAASFSSLASFTDGLANIAGAGGEPERVEQALVTANFFDVLGVQPQLGRGWSGSVERVGSTTLASTAFISTKIPKTVEDLGGISGCIATLSEGGEMLAFNRGERGRASGITSIRPYGITSKPANEEDTNSWPLLPGLAQPR